MAKFIALPQYYHDKPIVVNIDKIYFIRDSIKHQCGSQVSLEKDIFIDVNLPVDKLTVLLNSKD